MSGAEYQVILFDSVNAALLAEKLLKREGIPFKVIPVPRHLSSDCGVCIRIPAHERERAKHSLAKGVHIQGIHAL
ncbi:MAG TPA: DUF3343 domain-containing protein [Deltaproteobacteria bacterium]|nr:DUF3343 domain-containing protein [Deltaproteobacteria bacterium]